MAYAALAEVPPVNGLYTAFVAPIIYAVFGTSKHASFGMKVTIIYLATYVSYSISFRTVAYN